MSTPIATRPATSLLLTPRRALWTAVTLLAVLGVLLALAPAEQQLGNLVKVIYLHGALARSGMMGLIAAGALGLLCLARPRPALVRWSNAVQIAGMAAFVAHFVISVIPTRQTWGVWIAFDEPRTIMSLQIIGAGLVVVLARSLMIEDLTGRVSGLINLLLGLAVALLAARTGVLRHPLDAIGGSSSAAIQGFYAGIVVTTTALTALLAWWRAGGPSR